MKLNEQEVMFLKLIVKCFENNKLVAREEAIKELGVDDVAYEALVSIMLHKGAVQKIDNMRAKKYAELKPLARAVELLREIEGTEDIIPKPPDILAKILWIVRYGRKWWWLLMLALLIGLLSYLPKFACSKQDKNSDFESNVSPKTQSMDNRLKVTLASICAEIDSLPLAQQSLSAEQYSGMTIKRALLQVNEIQINLGDESRYDLRLNLPDETDSTNNQWIILCTVSEGQYPQLRLARIGMEFYVSGKVESFFWRFGERHIVLSNVSLEFE